MDYWADLRRRELVREEQERRLTSEARKAYATRTYSDKRPGASEIVASIDRRRADYPYEAGYHRWVGGWRMDLSRPVRRRGELPAGGWRRRIAHLSTFVAALLPPKKESRISRT